MKKNTVAGSVFPLLEGKNQRVSIVSTRVIANSLLWLLCVVLAQVSLFAQSGPLQVTAAVNPATAEHPCDVVNPQSPGGLLPAGYNWPPPQFLANPAGPEASDGRLNQILGSYAQTLDAHQILVGAVKAFLRIPSIAQGSAGAVSVPGDPSLAQPLAQLAVTGRRAFDSFRSWHLPVGTASGPQDGDLIQLVRQTNPTIQVNQAALQSAVSFVLDAAYSALWAIRANDPVWRAKRSQMGWIATSGEDDLPHRPVNIPTAHYPQYDVNFAIPGVAAPVSVSTRYMVASASDSLLLPPGIHAAVPAAAPRTIPPISNPSIPPQNKIIIYIHGGGSRLEEAVPLAEQLILAGVNKGVSYTVISFDMPNSGLSSRFDHTLVANSGPGGALGSYHPPQGDPTKSIPNPPLTYGYPIMDTEEQFVLNFLDAIDQQIGNVKGRIAAVMGGSLGGNISLRLARRANQYPYLRNIVAWSVTSMQPAQSDNIIGHIGGLIGDYTALEQNSTRHSFFDKLYNQPLISPALAAAIGGGTGAAAGGLVTGVTAIAGGLAGAAIGASAALPPQPQLWYSDAWPCKRSLIQQTKFDRYEYYTPEYRRWTIRLNYEFTIYSFQDGDLYAPNKFQGPPRYLTVNSRLFLASGSQDEHGPLYTLYDSTNQVAREMANTPGTTLFLNNTGHSIHDERPVFFAQQIVDFLNPPPPLSAVILQQGLSAFGGTSWIRVKAVDPTGREVPATVSINGATGSTNQNITFKNDCTVDQVIAGVNKNTRGAATGTVVNTGKKEPIACRGTVSAPGFLTGSFTAGLLLPNAVR
jgi:pimeloyl-ACP methyl ester carboxylesterase